MLMYRGTGRDIEVLLCQPHSFGEKKRWGIPKGHLFPGESAIEAAHREFTEETGLQVPIVPKFYLGTILYPSGRKSVSVWTFEHNPPSGFRFKSNVSQRSMPDGTMTFAPEISKWEWFTINEAKLTIMPQQKEIIERFARFIEKNKEEIANGKEIRKDFGSAVNKDDRGI